MKTETKKVVKNAIVKLYEEDLRVQEQLSAIVDTLKKNKIKFSGSVTFVAGLFGDWPLNKKDTKRSKKGTPVSLSTVKMKKEFAKVKKTKTYKVINCFERNFRRYYEKGKNDTIKVAAKTVKTPAKKKPVMVAIYTNIEKQVMRLKKRQAMKKHAEVIESFEATLKVLNDIINEKEITTL